MSKKDFYYMLSLMLTLKKYDTDFEFDDIIYDEKVNDCLNDFYFSMLSEDKDIIDKHYNAFEEKYKKLNDEQQEIAKERISKILDIDYKPKRKIKER